MKKACVISLFLLAACAQPDIRMQRPEAESVRMELDIQRPKAFLDIHHRTVAEAQDRNFWHLRFQTAQDEWGIFLNPFIDLSVYNTRNTRFDADYRILLPNAKWRKDVLNQGVLTSAVGQWGHFQYEEPSSFQEVYLMTIARPSDTLIYKFQLLNAQGGDYHIRFSLIDGSEESQVVVHKDPSRTHNYLNFYGPGLQPEIEPPKSQWQVEFSFSADTTFFNAGPPIYSIGDQQLYPTLFLNSEVEYVQTELPFESLDYFDVRDLDFVHQSYLLNPFVRYDPVYERYVALPAMVLLMRWDGYYCKMQLEDLQRGDQGEFILILRVQNL